MYFRSNLPIQKAPIFDVGNVPELLGSFKSKETHLSNTTRIRNNSCAANWSDNMYFIAKSYYSNTCSTYLALRCAWKIILKSSEHCNPKLSVFCHLLCLLDLQMKITQEFLLTGNRSQQLAWLCTTSLGSDSCPQPNTYAQGAALHTPAPSLQI